MYIYKCKHDKLTVSFYASSASGAVVESPENYNLIFFGICNYCGTFVKVKLICKLKEITHLESLARELKNL